MNTDKRNSERTERKMKQSEIKAFVLGDGTVTLKECSNTEPIKIPVLTFFQPERDAFDDHPSTPAKSLMLYEKQVHQLYAVLKEYYEGAKTDEPK